LKALVKDHLRGVVLAGDWAANQYFGIYIYIIIYIYTHMYNSLELSYPKRVLQNIPQKNCKTGELGQDRLKVRWEAVMFLFNVVNLNV